MSRPSSITPPQIKQGMVLAAGFGKRMRPLTDKLPKPLLRLGGMTLLDRGLGHLRQAGVTRIVVNTHYLAADIATHLSDAPDILLSHEPEILETGGGVKNALPHFEDDPLFVVNSDAVWIDGPRPALARMAEAWDDEASDVLLLLHRTVAAGSYQGRGDFALDPLGIPCRRAETEIAPFVFAGVQILHPRLFRTAPDGPFSLNVLYDMAEAAGRLRAVVHDGDWFHVGTPRELQEAEVKIADDYSVSNSR